MTTALSDLDSTPTDVQCNLSAQSVHATTVTSTVSDMSCAVESLQLDAKQAQRALLPTCKSAMCSAQHKVYWTASRTDAAKLETLQAPPPRAAPAFLGAQCTTESKPRLRLAAVMQLTKWKDFLLT